MDYLKNSEIFIMILAFLPFILFIVGLNLIIYSLVKSRKKKLNLKLIISGSILIVIGLWRLNTSLVGAMNPNSQIQQNGSSK